MNIYVDSLVAWGPSVYRGKDAAQAERVGARNGHRWCHLFADEADHPALHTFAARIGLRRAWFQGDHYDLTPGRRALAVQRGAIEIDRRRAIEVWKLQRERRLGRLQPHV